jgi:hypothetical protein
MLFNLYIWIVERPPKADKSAPTDNQISLLMCIIAPPYGAGALDDTTGIIC